MRNVTLLMYSIFSGSSLHFPRAPFLLLIFLSAMVKSFQFKLAEKFLLEELTSNFHNDLESRWIGRTCSSSAAPDFTPSQGSAHTGREWSAPTTTRPFLPPL